MNDRDQLVREQAYRLWEAEGHPHDRAVHHWLQAEKLIPYEDEPAPASPVVPEQAPAPLDADTAPVLAPTGGENEPAGAIASPVSDVSLKPRPKRAPAAGVKKAPNGLAGTQTPD
ncbi:DUF2934 domain-containing protein [Ancylobacter sonchi]|uniref:DUF2934 domain-containing protein n=1 Tax=Ancylobacter sonchi TaxID=1937790 RepID=UPI001BD45FC0|nr:DUF2934 domain-containing protein [Ancylobacter sonchi]MBS7535298.1 DUF2934 domain-containing protein [Ancylobacter sonchi]